MADSRSPIIKAAHRLLDESEGVVDERDLHEIASRIAFEESLGASTRSAHAQATGQVIATVKHLERQATDMISHHRREQPRAWVRSQLVRAGFGEKAAERLLRDHFDRAHNPIFPFDQRDRDTYEELIAKASGVTPKTAKKIADAYPDGAGLSDATAAAFRQLGATDPQAKRLQAAFVLCSTVAMRAYVSVPDRKVSGPTTAARYLETQIGDAQQEKFMAVFLNSQQYVIDVKLIAVGSLADVAVHPREVFRDAVRLGAYSIVLAHNHPSGDTTPSPADIELTRRMVENGRLLGIPILDHLIVARRFGGVLEHRSLAEMRLIPPFPER